MSLECLPFLRPKIAETVEGCATVVESGMGSAADGA